MTPQLYCKFSDYLLSRFGAPVRKLSVDAGFSCPNRDGKISTVGCIFCQPRGFSGQNADPKIPVEEQLRAGIARSRGLKPVYYMAYFQPYTNTYAPLPRLESVYAMIRKFPEIKALAIGTRPDCVDEPIMSLIASYCPEYEVWLEYGLQTVHDPTLQALRRGHTAKDFYRAVELTRKYPDIKICAHVMLGLPGENEDQEQETAKTLARLAVEGVKLHPLHVVKGTAVAEAFAQGNFQPLAEDAYVHRVVGFLEHLRPDTVIQRLTADCPAPWLIAPAWVQTKQKIILAIENHLRSQGTHQGRLYP